jgi:hypothetical protein
MVLNGGMTETGSRSHDHGRTPWHTRSKRFALAGYDRLVDLWSFLAHDHFWATLAAALSLLVVLMGCGGGSTDFGAVQSMASDAKWCVEIYPRHPDCLAQTLEIDDTVEARRELYLTWTHGCDAAGGVFHDCTTE